MAQTQKLVKQNPKFNGVFSGVSIQIEVPNDYPGFQTVDVELPVELPSELLYLPIDCQFKATLTPGSEFKAKLFIAGKPSVSRVTFVAVEPVTFRGWTSQENWKKSIINFVDASTKDNKPALRKRPAKKK